MITRPLDLQSKLAPPARDFDVLAWLTVGAIALFFGLLGSRFVLTPGIAVGLGQDGPVGLPSVPNAELSAASVVVSYHRSNMILFEGGIYDLERLGPALKAYAKRHPGAEMLVRMDGQVSTQEFFKLAALVREAGFGKAVFAAEPAVEATNRLTQGGL